MKSEGATSWLYSYRFGNVSDPLLAPALPGAKLSPLLPATGPLWIELDALADVRDCAIEISFGREGYTAIMESGSGLF